MTDVRATFELADGGTHGSLAWVQVRPRSETADFASAELGFRGIALAKLVIHDRLGQSSTLEFSDSARNAAIDEAELRFQPPSGVDLIGQAQPLPEIRMNTLRHARVWYLLGAVLTLLVVIASLVPARDLPRLHISDRSNTWSRIWP